MVTPLGTAGRPLAGVALFALVGLTLDSLGSATVGLDEAAFERYCRVVDGSGIAATLQILVCFGPAVWLLFQDALRLRQDTSLARWRRRGWLLLNGVALAQVAGYVLLLRLPWIAERVTPHARVGLWSARLSETSWGIPLTSFSLAVGTGSLFLAVGAAAVRAIHDSGYAQNHGVTQRFSATVWLVCGVDCALVMLTLIVFATGGLL